MSINDTHPLIDHFDGFGLNDRIQILRDDRDPDAGNASHEYRLLLDGDQHVAKISFQHGARDEEGSTGGITDAALIAVIIDRHRGLQGGPYACRENAMVITKLEEALHWTRSRAWERAWVRTRKQQGVLGQNKAHKS